VEEWNRKQAQQPSSSANYRSSSRTDEIRSLIHESDRHVPLRSMLDVGCAEGSITAALGEFLRLSPEHVSRWRKKEREREREREREGGRKGEECCTQTCVEFSSVVFSMVSK
jgi:hypothetical protein